MEQRNNGSVSPSATLSAAVKAALQRDGETATVQRLQLSRIALTKLAAGLPTRRGTQALAAIRLGLIDEMGPNEVGRG